MGASLHEYRAVLLKIDSKFAEIAARHGTSIQCRAGCHGCCLPGLSVSRIEAAHISLWLAEDPDRGAALRANLGANPHAGSRCALLDADGQCLIYPVRPALCRVHGAPTRMVQDGEARLDVCPLNFAGQDLAALAPGDCVDQELVATLLFVVGQRFDPVGAGERTTLAKLVPSA